MYRFKILLSCTFFTWCASTFASTTALPQPLPELYWAQNNAPPFFITEGPGKGGGFGGPLQRMIEEELPQYQHITHQMPLRRLNQFWRRGANYCFATMIYQNLQPDADYLLSRPNVYYRPHGVIAARDNPAVKRIKLRYPPSTSAYSLNDFFHEPNMRFGLMSNRTFGPRLDAILNEHKNQIDVYDRSDADSLEGLFAMLKLGRVDYLIDYPFVFRYYDAQDEYRRVLEFIPIQENAQEGVWGAIGCSNNSWGEQRISAINGAIDRLMNRADYRELVVQWHAAEGEEREYWNRLQDKVASFSNGRAQP